MKVPVNSFLVILLLLMTSCFDVIDEINLNQDGSGEFLLTVNMSRSKSRLESIMLLETFRGQPVPSKTDIETFIDDIVLTLKDSDGISNVSRTIDFDEFIFTLSFDFKSVNNINSAIEQLTHRHSKKPDSFSLSYSYDPVSREFTRYYKPQPDDKDSLDEMDEEDRKMVNEAIFTSICRFELPVEECTNKKAVISKSGHAVMLRSSAVNIVRGNTSITNTIRLK